MNTIKDQIRRNLAMGDKLVPNFSGELKQNTGLEVGDVFTLPCKFEIFERRIGDIVSQFILVVNQYGEIREFYPQQITRKVGVYEDGMFTGRYVRGQGSVNEHAKNFFCYAELMDSLKGKTIRVSEKTIVNSTYGYRSIYHLDFV